MPVYQFKNAVRGFTNRYRARGSVAVAATVGIGLTILFWHETATVRRTTSAVYDEVAYVRMGLSVRRGEFGPLVDAGTAPLPVLLNAVVLAPFRVEDTSTRLLPRIIDRVRRLHAATVGLPMVMALYLWLLRRRGWLVGGCAALFVALSPTFLGHASLATSDAAVTLWSVVTLAALAWHHGRPNSSRRVVVALVLGIAFAAKYSAVCLLPAVVFSVGWRRAPAVVAGAAVVLWALHGFFTTPLVNADELFAGLGTGPAVQRVVALASATSVPGPLAGALEQWTHQRGGTDAFLLGTTDSGGWWYYLPLAISLKSTPAELGVVAALPVFVMLAWARGDHALVLWVLTLVSFAAVLLLSHVNIGVRYALPLYPLTVLCVADTLPLLPIRRSVMAVVMAIAVAGQAFSSLAVAPHYLSYFNWIAGGPAGGHRYLSDSNLDWGQDLPALADTIARLGNPRVCLAYFGAARPSAYGIAAIDWQDSSACRGAQWLAVSVTYLQGSFIERAPFSPLLSEAPDHRAAFSIFLYDMRRPVVAAALEKAWRAATD